MYSLVLWYHLLPLVTASLKGCSDGITCRTVNASGLSFDCRFAVPTTTPASELVCRDNQGTFECAILPQASGL